MAAADAAAAADLSRNRVARGRSHRPGQHLPRIASAHASNKPPPHTSLPSVLHYVDLYTTHSAGLLQALAAASHAPHDPQLLHWQGLVAYDFQQL